jgi:hypothetical protein
VTYLRAAAPERDWTPSAVTRLLGSATYLGRVQYGELVQDGAHEPLIDPRTHALAVAHLERTRPRRGTASADYPLSGIATCGSCGGPLIGSQARKSSRLYRCSNANRRGGACEAPVTIGAKRLEEYVEAKLREQSNGNSREDALRALTRAEAAVERAQAAVAEWATMPTEQREALPEGVYAAGLAERTDHFTTAKAAHARAIEQARSTSAKGNPLAGVREVVVRKVTDRRAPVEQRVTVTL